MSEDFLVSIETAYISYFIDNFIHYFCLTLHIRIGSRKMFASYESVMFTTGKQENGKTNCIKASILLFNVGAACNRIEE